jgi:hypothetical protein
MKHSAADPWRLTRVGTVGVHGTVGASIISRKVNWRSETELTYPLKVIRQPHFWTGVDKSPGIETVKRPLAPCRESQGLVQPRQRCNMELP